MMVRSALQRQPLQLMCAGVGLCFLVQEHSSNILAASANVEVAVVVAVAAANAAIVAAKAAIVAAASWQA